MTSAPKGEKEIAVGDELKPLIVRRQFSPAMAAELENKLRETLQRGAAK